MLQRSFRVQTRYGGGFVQSINAISGSGSRVNWFYYVNGIQAPVGAAGTAVHRGDRIWWDLHDWGATASVPAVVGSFPEPFVHGIGGKRLPTTVECAPDMTAPCAVVSSALRSAGVPVASQLLGTGSGTESLGVVVGTWNELRSQLGASLINQGPSASGIYARFDRTGRALSLLDSHARAARTLGAGAGLVAATAQRSQPTWLVTGTDPTGVLAAARALSSKRLHDHFALAVHGTSDLPIPVQSGS